MSLSYRVKCVSYRNYIHLPSDCIREMLQFWHCTLDCDPCESHLPPSPVSADTVSCAFRRGCVSGGLQGGADMSWVRIEDCYCGRELTGGSCHWPSDIALREERRVTVRPHTRTHHAQSVRNVNTGPRTDIQVQSRASVLTSDGDIHSLLIFSIARSILNLQSPSIFYVI